MQTQKVNKIIFWLIISNALIYLLSISNFNCAPPTNSIGDPKQVNAIDSLTIKNLEKYQKSIDNEYQVGLQHYLNGQFREAVNHFQSTIQLDTIRYHKNVWSKIVDSYQQLELADSAILFCEKGLEQHPRKIELWLQGAALQEKLENRKKAIPYYQKLVKLIPHSPDCWRKLANLCAQKDVEAAIQAYDIVMILNSEDTSSKQIQTDLLLRTGDPTSVLDRMLRIKRQNTGESQPIFNLGQYYFIKGDYPSAEIEFREYLKIEPTDEIGREYLAASFQNQGKYDAAINVYLTILAMNPQHVKSLCEVAYCLKKLEKFEQAREYVLQARKIDPDYALGYIVLGEIYQKVTENCQKARKRVVPDWDDKLIYQMAHDQYKAALNDSLFKSMAKNKLQAIERFIPTNEDWFMHPDDKQAKLKCYEWIYK
ncbi:tetratricopeptide repeat protein [candidate division KSB1 bacterium]|nr:tetratricopeptide repeat protein [candidate division KSB1 bacterium]